MEIHKIRPVHGWREFFGEVGIIVIGVLIALGAEQVVEWFHWRHVAETAYDALGKELAQSKGNAIERIRIFSCVDRRLDELSAIVDVAARAGRLPPLGTIGYPPSRSFPIAAWTSVLASDLPNHLDSRRRAAFGDVYDSVESMRTMADREMPIWTDLWQLSGPGRDFDASAADLARGKIGQARFANRYLGLVSAQLLGSLRDYKIEVDEGNAFVKEASSEDLSKAGACRTIGRVPLPNYGAAPWLNALPEIILAPGDKGPPPPPAYR